LDVGRRGFLKGALGVGAGLALPGLLTACSSSGGSAPRSGPVSGDANAPATLEFWSWTTGIAKVVDIWNKKNPHQQVKVSTETQGDPLITKILTANRAGNPPDLIHAEYQALPVFVTNQVVMDLSASAPKLNSAFSSGTMQLVTFNDKPYGIPQDVGPMMLYYRKDLFDKYSLSVPETWDEFAAVAKQVKAKDSKAYLTTFSSGDPGWFAGLAEQAGASWWTYVDNAWQLGINDSATQKVASYWGELVNTGVIQGQPMYTPQWNTEMSNGTLLAWPSAVWGAGVLTGVAGNTKGKWEMTAMPQWSAGDNKTGYWGGSATAVAAKSKQQAQAIKFATWLNTDPEALNALISISGVYPAATTGQSSPHLAKAPAFMPNQPDFFKTAAKIAATATGFTWGPNVNVTYSTYEDAFGKAIQSKSDFTGALNTMQNASIADLKKRGFSVKGG
jgi:multiple sugar transport system substrate-binding protein